MNYYAGLDVSMEVTSIAIMNQEGKIVFESSCKTDPKAITELLKSSNFTLTKIGIESGCITFWLIEELKNLKIDAICVDARHIATLIALNVNKTDKNDARVIANAMRCNLYKEVHHKTKESIEVGLQMGTRRTLLNVRTKLKNSIRGFLKAYGIRLKTVSHTDFPAKVRDALVCYTNDVQQAIEGLLKSYEEVCKNIEESEKALTKLSKTDPVIQLFESIPGIGPITAITYKAVIDNPHRFKKARDVGAYIGLTPTQYSSGDSIKQGGVSKRGSPELRNLLVECAIVILTISKKWSKLKAWGLKIMKKHGIKKAAAAVARKLSIIMLRMWQEGKPFIYGEKKEKINKETKDDVTMQKINRNSETRIREKKAA